jgi:hypothetical protein
MAPRIRPGFEACTQPQCLLRSEGMGSEFLAELVVRLLSGEDLSGVVPPDRLITRKERCLRCVRSVMQDRGAFATAEELKRIEAGKRASRRMRSHRRWSSAEFEL